MRVIVREIVQMDNWLVNIAQRRDACPERSNEWAAHEQEHRFFDEIRQNLIRTASDWDLEQYEQERHNYL